MTLIVRPPGLVMYGDGYHGHGIHITDWSGWVGEVEFDRDDIPVAGGDGTHTSPTYARRRSIPFGGFLVATSFDERDRILMQMQSLFDLGRYEEFPLTVERDGRVYSGRAHLPEYPVTDAAGFVPEATWRMTFEMDEPRLFGQVNRFTEPLVLQQWGNTAADVTFTVTGQGTYSLTAGSEVFEVTGLTTGKTDVINLAAGTVHRDGVLQGAVVTKVGYWTVPPATAVPVAVAGTVNVSAAVPDAYL